MIPFATVLIGPDQIECHVLSADIHHGRDDATTQPIASTAVIEVIGDLPDTIDIGQPLIVNAVIDNLITPRFVGEITDIRMAWASVDLPTPQIIAAGNLARIGRRIVGDVPWPEELDGDRITRILTLAGFPPDPLYSDAGTVNVLARDVDKQFALDLAHETAIDGGGILWQDVAGRILYADAEHRRNARLAYTFDACNVGVGCGWVKSLEGVVNDLHLRYGPTPVGGGEQAEVHALDQASIDASDTFAASISTSISLQADAQKRANEIIVRQADTSWILGGLEVDLAFLPETDILALLSIVNIHDMIAVIGLPPDGPAADTLLWVEGWHETIEAESWRIAYATSDYCRTAAFARWDDMIQSVTWDSVDPTLVWDKAACFPPLTAGGSAWDQTPATTRWDTVDPAINWDQWG